MTTIRIGNRLIGNGHPCYVIAEAGSNHNGSLEQAKALIDVAAYAGADAVKFQTFRAETMYPRESGSVEYLKALGVDKSIYDIIAEMEMPYDWIPTLAEYCGGKGMDFLSTPFDERAVDLLAPYVPTFKIASYELTHLPLIRHAAATGKPLIVSTGAGSLAETRDAVDAVLENSAAGICLMQCTAKYPAPLGAINVRVIRTLIDMFQVPVGLSDHSAEVATAAAAAVAVGASLIEKHFTLSRRLPGPDHSFALEPHELKAMVDTIRQTEQVLGDGAKTLHPVEQELVNYRRSVYTRRRIEADQVISLDDLIVLRRPGIAEPGIAPKHLAELVGRKARHGIGVQTLLTSEDIEPPIGA